MFETICTLPLSSELFTQAIHPRESIVAVGLSSGLVQSYRLPTVASASDDEDGNASVLSTGTATIETLWQTRRHKGSCRCLGFSIDGEVLYSAGTDGLVKAASSSTGQVVAKFAVPFVPSTLAVDPPTILHALSPQTLLLGTDSAALHLCDLRSASSFASATPVQTYHPHDDYISSLTPLPPSETSTSGFSKQWITTGGTTLAVTDLRRGVLVKSEDQEEELLSSVFVSGLPSKPGRSRGEKVLVGSGGGVLTLWERGVWDDQDGRVIVDTGRGGGESLDVLAVMPPGVGDGGNNIVVGVGDGTIRIVKLGPNKTIGEWLKHDDLEGVVGLGFDVGRRMISGGGRVVKVWQEAVDGEDEDEDDEEEEEEKEEEEEEEEEGNQDDSGRSSRKHKRQDSDSSDAEDSDKGLGKTRPRKRKRNKGKKDKSAEKKNGVLGFKSMD